MTGGILTDAGPTKDELTSSVFSDALQKYFNDLAPNKQQKEFISSSYPPQQPFSAETVQNLLHQLEHRSDQTNSSKISKVFKRVFEAIKEYSGVIDTLVSADPMPSALIWGGLSIIIDSATRHYELLSNVQSHLQQMSDILNRLAQYEQLYKHLNNPALQELLCESYICVFELLSRIHKDISKTRFQTTISSTSPKSIQRLNDLVDKLRRKDESVRSQIQILDSELIRNMQIEIKVTTWLKQGVTAACRSRQSGLEQDRHPGTFSWIDEHPQISTWLSEEPCDLRFRVLPLYASPGCGKSTLCAHIIGTLLKARPSTPVLYHYYRFDEAFKAEDILRHFASQLFNTFVTSGLCSSAMLRGFKKIIDDANSAENMVRDLAAHFPAVWIFLDGLDEGKEQKEHWTQTLNVVHFLLDLTKTTSNVRLWSSSQDMGDIRNVFSDYKPINLESRMKEDMTKFLSMKVMGLKMPEDGRKLLITKFEEDVYGFFLAAKRLIEELELAHSPDDMKKIINQGPSLDKYYSRYFRRITENDRVDASRMFALVAYARRPLRIGELQEAIAILKSLEPHQSQHVVQNIPQSQLPFISFIKRIGPPLIVFKAEDNQTDERMEVCHLSHFTVLRFLGKHPDILGVKDNEGIVPGVIADACITYLLQLRYSSNLKKCIMDGKEKWTDAEGSAISDHRFLSYAAKYWDKHRDILPASRSPHEQLEMLEAISLPIWGNVMDFLKSDNFRTCLQIQSLLIDMQFFVPTGSRHRPDQSFLCLKRALPNWCLHKGGAGYWKEYEEFCHEWMTVLCPTFMDTNAQRFLQSCLGEIDRCWWGALAPDNFLRRLDGRHPSFRLERTNKPRPGSYLCSMVFDTGTQVGELHFSVNGAAASIFLERWSLDRGKFELVTSEQHTIDKRCLNLEQYTICEECLAPRDDRANLVHFDCSGNCFRIGTQVYLSHTQNSFLQVNIPGLEYVEEIASRGSIIAIAERRKPLKGCDVQSFKGEYKHSCGQTVPLGGDEFDTDKHVQRFYNLHGFEAWPPPLKDTSTYNPTAQSSNDDGGSSESSIDITSDNESSGDAYESWSECSSDCARNSFEREDIERRWLQHPSLPHPISSGESEDSDSDSVHVSSKASDELEDLDEFDDADLEVSEDLDEYDEADSEVSEESHELNEISDSDNSVGVCSRELGGYRIRPIGEDVLSSDEEDAYYERYRARMPRGKTKKTGTPFLARLRVYNAQSHNAQSHNAQSHNAQSLQMPKEVFSFSTGLQLPLHGSPPAIHSIHSLVVWPLSGGKLLFGDFETGSYFIRKLKTSTSITRHIFMKCHFSTCGKFLHVAALEAMTDRNEATSESQSLAMVAYTFSLCSSQPTRSPPTFVHQARVDLGQYYTESSVDDLPFTLTWSEKMLYVVKRSLTLEVYRISLFPETTAGRGVYPVFRPEKTIVLPGTSLRRNVHFFPSSQDGNGHARLILSAHSVYPQGLPAIGCFLNEEVDLGEWVQSGMQDVPEPHGDGHFVRPTERFNPEEDCDLQPFSFLE